jgi:hypothetical protein
MIEDTLEERGKNYGNYHTMANLSQTLYSILVQHYSTIHAAEDGTVQQLPNFMTESLQMICRKMARIANGNIYHVDSWDDIAGYATLVSNILKDAQERALEKAVQQVVVPPQDEEEVPNE